MTTPLQLFSYFRSSSAYRVRIALNIKQIPYEIIAIHLLKDGGQQYLEEYRAINPSAQVPTLVDNGNAIGQSLAILEYLEEQFPQTPLLPKPFLDKAIVRQMSEIINSGMQPLQNLSVTNYLSHHLSISEEQKKQWLSTWMQRGFESLECLFEKYSGQFSFGDKVTLADCCLIPQVFSAQRFGVDLSPFPKTLEIYKTALQLTAFINASPERQADYQP